MSKEVSIISATVDTKGYYTIMLSNDDNVYGEARDIPSGLFSAGLCSMTTDDLESAGLTPEEADVLINYW